MVALFLLLAILNAIDAIQTIKALQSGYDEINPLGRWLFDRVGLKAGVIGFKAAMIVGAALVTGLAPIAYALAILLPFIGWGIFAVVHNYREMSS